MPGIEEAPGWVAAAISVGVSGGSHRKTETVKTAEGSVRFPRYIIRADVSGYRDYLAENLTGDHRLQWPGGIICREEKDLEEAERVLTELGITCDVEDTFPYLESTIAKVREGERKYGPIRTRTEALNFIYHGDIPGEWRLPVLEDKVQTLEAEVATLRAELEALKAK